MTLSRRTSASTKYDVGDDCEMSSSTKMNKHNSVPCVPFVKNNSQSYNNRINQIRPTPLQWKASLGELAWPDRPGRARSRD